MIYPPAKTRKDIEIRINCISGDAFSNTEVINLCVQQVNETLDNVALFLAVNGYGDLAFDVTHMKI